MALLHSLTHRTSAFRQPDLLIWRAALWLLVQFMILGTATASLAQTETLTRPLQDTTETAPQVSPLETFYLRNKNGELLPVLNFTFEEWEQLFRKKDEVVTPEVSAGAKFQVLESRFKGTVNSQSRKANLRLTLRIQVTESGSVEVPLGLAHWALAGPVESESAKVELSRGSDQKLRLKFAAQQGQDYTFVFPLVSRVLQVGQTSKLPIAYPHASFTKFELSIDQPNLDLESWGVVGMDSETVADMTTVTVDELSENASFSWRESDEETRCFRTKAQLTTKTSLEALSMSRWQGSTSFQVTPLAPNITEILLAVPANASDFSAQNGVQVSSPMTWEQAKQHTASISDSLRERQFLLVEFLRGIQDDSEFTLNYLLNVPVEQDQATSEFVFEGLHAFDCIFISGTLELSNTQRELDTTHVTSTGILLSRTTAAQKDARQFELSRQDFRLTLTTRRRPARVTITPKYVLVLNGGMATLTVEYGGTVQGQFSDTISVPLKNWNYNATEGVVYEAENNHLLLNPATRMDLTSNNFKFGYVVQQPIEEVDIDLELPVPASSASVFIEPAVLIVVMGPDNREFIIDKNSSTFEVSKTETDFRSKTGTDILRLKGITALKPRVVEFQQQVDVLSSLAEPQGLTNGHDAEVHVRQWIRFDIRNQSLPRLWFLGTHFSDKCQIKRNGQVIPHRLSTFQVDGENWHALEPQFNNQELRGNLEFEIHDWAVPLSNTDTTETWTHWQVPIAQPMLTALSEVEALTDSKSLQELVRQQVESFSIAGRTVTTPDDRSMDYQLHGDWVPGAEVLSESTRTWLSFGAWPFQFQLGRKTLQDAGDAGLVEAAEQFTWWGKGRRLDRFVALVRTSESSIPIEIPADAGLERVMLDGSPVTTTSGLTDTLVQVELTPAGEPSVHVLEVWLSRSVSANLWYTAEAQPPQLPNWRWCHHYRWSLFADGSWQCLNWSPLFEAVKSEATGTRLATFPEPSARQDLASDQLASYLLKNPTGSAVPSLVLQASQIPTEQDVWLANRYWVRVSSIFLVFLCVLIAWWTRLYRNFYFWAFVGFTLALTYAGSPLLFSHLVPLVAVSFAAAVSVLLMESLARRKPRIFAEMDTFVGSTRTIAGSVSNGPGSQRDSNRLRDSASDRIVPDSERGG